MEAFFECIPSLSELCEIIQTAKDWALLNYLSKTSHTSCNSIIIEHYPFSLLPSPIPRKLYLEACEMHTILSELIHKVAHDHNFLKEALKETMKVDDFTKKSFDVYESVRREGFAQDISFGIFRSDFMLDDQKSLKLVEINTEIEGLIQGGITANLHQMILQEMGGEHLIKNILDSNALEKKASGMLEAWKMYNDERAAILFVIRNQKFSMVEECALQFEVKKLNPKIKVFRRTLQELTATAKLSPNKELIVENTIIALVFHRCNPYPEEHTSKEIWDLRLMIEESKAIKCPSIQYQLAETKKVQQALSAPGVLEKFINNPVIVSKVRKIFTGIYSLDFTDEGDRAAEMASANPDNFVLKPQREGGGHNVFGSEIVTTLKRLEENKERPAWILMEKIFPPTYTNYMIRSERVSTYEATKSDHEVGIIGVIIGDSGKIFSNKEVGYFVRAKPSHVNEAGIISGEGVSSSIYLM